MFWDEIHPSRDMHKLLSERAFDYITNLFKCISPCNDEAMNSPHAKLLQTFCDAFDVYNKSNNSAWLGLYGLFSYSTLKLDKKEPAVDNLNTILKHAYTENNSHTQTILKQLGWVNHKHQFTNASPPELFQLYKNRYGDDNAKNGVLYRK
tara:strand:- start:63 stop:512 length:450 start_codon:yes stop_codon:yes gene_type:complete